MMSSIVKKSAALLLAFTVTLTALVFSANIKASAAEAKTGIGLAEFGLQAYRDNWQYNYGSYGEAGANGLHYSDCSGLIYAYLCWQDGRVQHDYSMPRTVTAQANSSIASGPMSTLPRTHGLILTIANYDHVGIYLGNSRSVDNSTYGTNMRLRNIPTESSWIQWHKLGNVQYPTTGWYTFDGNPFYYQNGEYVVNTSLTIDGTAYSFDSAGTPSPRPSGYPEGGGDDGNGSDGSSIDKVAESGKTTAAVNLRRGPGLNYNVLKTVGNGTSLTVTNKDTAGWYKVKLSDGSTGYMSADYVSLDGGSSDPAPSVEIAAKTTAGVNLRKEPSTDASVLTVVPENTALTIIEKTSSSWYKVKLSNGSTGYMFASFLQETGNSPPPEPPAPPSDTESTTAYTTAAVNLRTGPSTGTGVVKVVASGTAITITDRSTAGWYRVKLADGSTGYMSADYVKEGSGTPAPPAETENIPAKTTAAVNLRTGPGMSYSVIKTVGNGIAVTITDRSTSGWYKVKLADGSTGYMSADYVTQSTGGEQPPAPPANGGTGAYTTVAVNLRTGAGMSSTVIRVVAGGTAITVTDKSNSEWYQVKLSDGTAGYMSAQYISEGGGSSPSDTMTTTAAVNLRSAGSLTATVLTVVPNGSSVTVLDRADSSWYKVRTSSGSEGYMSSQYLR